MRTQNLAIHPSKPIAHVLISFLWKMPAQIVSVSTARSSQLKQILPPLSLHSPTDETNTWHNGAEYPASKFPYHKYHQVHAGHKNCLLYLVSFRPQNPSIEAAIKKTRGGYNPTNQRPDECFQQRLELPATQSHRTSESEERVDYVPGTSGIQLFRYLQKNSPFGGSSSGLSRVP
jgi:hypothetical protein